MAGSTRATATRNRCQERIASLVDSSEAPGALIAEAAACIHRAIGFGSLWAGSFDPDTGLPSVHRVPLDPVWATAVPATLSASIDPGDPMVAAIGPPPRSLYAVTRRRPERSGMWSECLRPDGFGDVIRVLAQDAHGVWGGCLLHRGGDDAAFTDADGEWLAASAAPLGTLLRRASLPPQDTPLPLPRPPAQAGTLLLDERGAVYATSGPVAAWLASFPDREDTGGWDQLPAAIYSVVGGVRSARGDLPASVRVPVGGGAWAVVDAAQADGVWERRIAVTIRPASAAETMTLMCRAIRLTSRETEICGLMARGLDTQEIAARLVISPHTVKEHLKSIFRKSGTGTRPELLSVLSGAAGPLG